MSLLLCCALHFVKPLQLKYRSSTRTFIVCKLWLSLPRHVCNFWLTNYISHITCGYRSTGGRAETVTRTQAYSFLFEKRTTSKIVATFWNVTSEQIRLYIRNMRQFKVYWSAGQTLNLWTACSENPAFTLQVANT